MSCSWTPLVPIIIILVQERRVSLDHDPRFFSSRCSFSHKEKRIPSHSVVMIMVIHERRCEHKREWERITWEKRADAPFRRWFSWPSSLLDPNKHYLGFGLLFFASFSVSHNCPSHHHTPGHLPCPAFSWAIFSLSFKSRNDDGVQQTN